MRFQRIFAIANAIADATTDEEVICPELYAHNQSSNADFEVSRLVFILRTECILEQGIKTRVAALQVPSAGHLPLTSVHSTCQRKEYENLRSTYSIVRQLPVSNAGSFVFMCV